LAGLWRFINGMCHLAQEFTFEWATHEHDELSVEGAEATLRGMAGRLTALIVPDAAEEHLLAMQQAGPQLAGALSSLSFKFSEQLSCFHAATHAILAVSAGLQHVHVGLDSEPSDLGYSDAAIQAAEAAFQDLMRSLPCCQSLCFNACGAVSYQAMGRELLRRGPDLVSLTLSIEQIDDLVSTCPHDTLPNVSYHPVDCRLACSMPLSLIPDCALVC
jgi:hypothetical protein